MRIFRDTGSAVSISANTDELIGSTNLPNNSSLNNLWMESHIFGPDESSVNGQYMYAITGYMLPVLDPDTPINHRDLWDAIIPKSQEVGSNIFDMDTGAGVSAPDFEIGEIDFESMFDLGVGDPRRFFKRVKRISAAQNATGYTQKDSAADTFKPTDLLKTKIGKRVKVHEPSVAAIGFSSPEMADTTTVHDATLSEANWIKLQYINQTFDQMLDYLIGLTSEGTGTTPYDEAAALIADYVAPDFYEVAGLAGAWSGVTWQAYTTMTWDISIEGRLNVNTISAGD